MIPNSKNKDWHCDIVFHPTTNLKHTSASNFDIKSDYISEIWIKMIATTVLVIEKKSNWGLPILTQLKLQFFDEFAFLYELTSAKAMLSSSKPFVQFNKHLKEPKLRTVSKNCWRVRKLSLFYLNGFEKEFYGIVCFFIKNTIFSVLVNSCFVDVPSQQTSLNCVTQKYFVEMTTWLCQLIQQRCDDMREPVVKKILCHLFQIVSSFPTQIWHLTSVDGDIITVPGFI